MQNEVEPPTPVEEGLQPKKESILGPEPKNFEPDRLAQAGSIASVRSASESPTAESAGLYSTASGH
jgi:hypothetical protein